MARIKDINIKRCYDNGSGYFCTCKRCGCDYIGPKRSIHCFICNEEIEEEVKLEELDFIQN